MPRRSLLIALAALLTTCAIHAETAASSDWPTSKRSLPRVVTIATVSNTQARFRCHVRAITADILTCRAGKDPQTVFQRDEIAAIIQPWHANMKGSYIFWTVSAACLASSFFVPIVPSVLLRVLTFGFFYGGAYGDNGTDAHVIYWRPGTAVTLP